MKQDKYYYRKWRRSHSGHSTKYMHKVRFGNSRKFVLERDHYQCVGCGMTNVEHKQLWHRELTINHIDHQGRNSDNPNNEFDNLETLCLRCHGYKDAIQHGRYSKYRFC